MILCNVLSSPLPPPPLLTPNPTSSRRFAVFCRRGNSAWDSNAEPVRTGKFEEEEFKRKSSNSSSRRWWSDELDDVEEYDPFDDGDDKEEDLWDKIWIFKVFKAYGYLLPAFIASLLLATGPKAFLMALALPLGQSAISLAIDWVWGRAGGEPRTKTKSRRKPFARSSSSFRKQKQEERSSQYRGKDGYQSWASADSGVTDKSNGPRRSSFGGWDELDNQKGSIGSQGPRTNGSAQSEPVKGKLSKRGRYKDSPLFLRLLIAIFPFLGSWTRML